MKYVVLSFDDGLKNFMDNVFPILEEKGIKASINVISGYSDKTIKTDFDYINYDDIKYLYSKGYEIANHTNSHIEPTTFDDFIECEEKLVKLIGDGALGAVLPFSQSISKELLEQLKDRYLYVSDVWDERYKKKKKHKVIYKFARLFNREDFVFYYNNLYYIYNLNYLNSKSPCLRRIPVKTINNPNSYYYIIRKLKNNECISIMFHSIVKELDEKTPWAEGNWTVSQFSKFIDLISNDTSICVLTQKELISRAKKY